MNEAFAFTPSNSDTLTIGGTFFEYAPFWALMAFCSAATSSSYCDDLFSSSCLCRIRTARPLEINASAKLPPIINIVYKLYNLYTIYLQLNNTLECNSSTSALRKDFSVLLLLWPHVINFDLNFFTNNFLPQKFTSFK